MEHNNNNNNNKKKNKNDKNSIPSISTSAVFVESVSMPDDIPICRGHEFDKRKITQTTTKKNDEKKIQQQQQHTTTRRRGTKNDNFVDNDDDDEDTSSMDVDIMSMMESYKTTGFQATNVGLAIEQINEMRNWRLSHEPITDTDDDILLQDMTIRERIRCRIFLAYTSNQISCGQREIIRFLVQYHMIDVIITTAGGIEEDIIKCLQPTFMGDFAYNNGKILRKQGINRIGNLLIPNKNYCIFEDWLTPILHQMHNEQDEAMMKKKYAASSSNNNKKKDEDDDDDDDNNIFWTPSKFIHRLGTEINNTDSVLYWAARNNIPIFCPALTDGSIGDMIYFHSYKRSGFILDIAHDIRRLNDIAIKSHRTGQIIMGGGLIKHHCNNANLMRNGCHYSIYINTSCEYDGSDSGASPDEAISWGKIHINAKRPIKITADATIVFPLLVAATFAQNVQQWKQQNKNTVCYIDDIRIIQQEQEHNTDKQK